MKITNAVVHTPPFEGWGNHSTAQHAPLFACDEMIFAEPIRKGLVELNGRIFIVVYNEGDVDLTEGSTLPAQLKEVTQ
tara:strand:+ start:159 stop:392 length:234 start_codon:yes stop_codon:yes gene_type:complete